MMPALKIGASIPCFRDDGTMKEQAPHGTITEVEAAPAAYRAIPRELKQMLDDLLSRPHDPLTEEIGVLADSLGEMCTRMEALMHEIRTISDTAASLIGDRKSGTAAQHSVSPAPRRYANANISVREKEVLTHLLGGKSNREISRELRISEKTVKNHLWKIYRKIGVRNRTQLFHHLICS
jgi:DNA-binding CsgD family transcriptional regulator